MRIIRFVQLVLCCILVVFVFSCSDVIVPAYTDIDYITNITNENQYQNFCRINSINYYVSNQENNLCCYKNIIINSTTILNKYEKVILIHEDENWITVLKDKKIFYINKKYQQTTTQAPIVTIDENPLSEDSVYQDTSYKDTVCEDVLDVVDNESITFTQTEKTMYVASTTLNVRTGPGTEFKQITTLTQNTPVTVIGIGSNNWCKIYYELNEAYVFGGYLSDKKVEQSKKETVSEEMERRGSMGRLSIPSCGLSVALFKSSSYDSNHSQQIVDNADSAAYMPDEYQYWGFIIIADHVHQGFGAIKNAIPDKTVANIDYGTYVDKYICTNIFTGKNVGYDLVDMQGVTIRGKNDNGITMYTCNSDGTITITFWQPL